MSYPSDLGGFRRDDDSSLDKQEVELRGLLRSRASNRRSTLLKALGGGAALAIVIVIVVAAELPSQESGCGSEATKQLVLKIAREKTDNALASNVIPKIEPYLSEVAQAKRVLYETNRQIGRETMTGIERYRRSNDALNTVDAANLAAMQQTSEKVIKYGHYSLDIIRMDGRDSETKAVTCAAKMTLTIDDQTVEKDVRYKVEMTSTRGIYVTVFGL